MKIFRSESLVDYSTYTFNYATYCIQDKPEELTDIYDKGFLPYSNQLDLRVQAYYLARSLRVELDRFNQSSENRRVLKNLTDMNPDFKVHSIHDFNLKDPSFLNYCLNFSKERFSEPLSEERLSYILNWPSLTHVIEFFLDGRKVGYVLGIMNEQTFHYWFAFFDLDNPSLSLGKWMMYSAIEFAAEQDLKYVYLGTCYGEKSLYKVRDFKGLAYFDGNEWSSDMKQLKTKCKTDALPKADLFKTATDTFL